MALDLRTGKTVWQQDGFPHSKHEPLAENIDTQVAIVGGGITGALLAYQLTQSGFQVVLLDRREPGAGSTTASTAILSYETDVMLQDMVKHIGAKNGARVFQAGQEALQLVEKLVSKIGNTCGFEHRDSVYFASTEDDLAMLHEEYHLRKELGFEVEFLFRDDFVRQYSFEAAGALRTPNMAQINPLAFTRHLIKAAEEKGMKVFSQTHVTGYSYNKELKFNTLTTERGAFVTARHTIFATGYESQQMLHQAHVKLNSSYAIASEPVSGFSGWHGRTSLWETARPYLYLRTTSDNRILVGGEDEPFENEQARDLLLPQKAETLYRKAKEMFPDIPFEAALAWAGTFAESSDGLPYIGRHNQYPGAYFALGYGGNGITFGAMACPMVLDWVQGRENPDEKIFAFGR